MVYMITVILALLNKFSSIFPASVMHMFAHNTTGVQVCYK